MKKLLIELYPKILLGLVICCALISLVLWNNILSLKKELTQAQTIAVSYYNKYNSLKAKNDNYRAKLEKYHHLKQIKEDLSKDIPLKTKPSP